MYEDIFKKIEDYSITLGFEDIRVTELDKLNFYSANLRYFIKKKYHGEMDWIEKKAKIREHPNNMWSEAKSALVFSFNYGPESNPLPETTKIDKGYISIYARRKDYHKVLKTKLKKVCHYISKISNIKVKVFVDTAPLMEKPLAEKASIGWIGKHTNLVSKKFGSWLFLGIILTNHDFNQTESQIKNHCGGCNACNKICPTNAFVSPYKLDARKCISYLTIEHKSHIDRKFREPIGNRIFGCDDCLAICPWNKFAKKNSDINIDIKNNLTLPSLNFLIDLDEDNFRLIFAGTPIRRLGYVRFLRNTLIAAGNSKDNSLIKKITKKLDHSNVLIRSMAVWALSKLSYTDFLKEKKKRLPQEKDIYIKNEWKLGLAK